jgi:hypothetical protein
LIELLFGLIELLFGMVKKSCMTNLPIRLASQASVHRAYQAARDADRSVAKAKTGKMRNKHGFKMK